MTDWSKLKVAELKEECKERNIPLTGLKLKQQYIDKLEEIEARSAEAANESGTELQEDEPAAEARGEIAEVPNREALPETYNPAEPQKVDLHTEGQDGELKAQSPELGLNSENVPDTNQTIQAEREDAEAEPQSEFSEHPGNSSAEEAASTTEPQVFNGVPQKESSAAEPIEVPPMTKTASTLENGVPSVEAAPTSTPSNELADYQRKRKRRSVTPAPTVEDVPLKKARANDGTTIIMERESSALEIVQKATDSAWAMREADALPKDDAEQTVVPLQPPKPEENEENLRPDAESTPPAQEEPDQPQAEESRAQESTPPVDDLVAPALHCPTSSLYIRNFKRPLHIPTLKEHIQKLAQTTSEDHLKTFYLDSIRTHAFISFASKEAASRVRFAMHETRFPDEPLRERLFVDYIPDDKVQEWIDRETGGFGRGGNTKRYEVVYIEGPDGVVASLQDSETARGRPSLTQQTSAQAKAVTRPLISGVHRDRSAIMPQEEQYKVSIPQRAPQPRDAGETGFKALDELFSFTTTKPKLYYKPAMPEVVDDRLDMIRGLRVGHSEMGRSGEEGMKRYTFEKYKGSEDWVDKGPEFGHGQRGQNILMGMRGRGGYGYRGGRGDSWRGR